MRFQGKSHRKSFDADERLTPAELILFSFARVAAAAVCGELALRQADAVLFFDATTSRRAIFVFGAIHHAHAAGKIVAEDASRSRCTLRVVAARAADRGAVDADRAAATNHRESEDQQQYR